MVLIGYIIPVIGLVALLFALGWGLLLRRKAPGGDRLKQLAGLAGKGAKAFGAREHVFFDLFVLVVLGGVFLAGHFAGAAKPWPTAAWGVVGALCAGLTAWLGLRASQSAAVRAAHAVEGAFAPAHRLAFSGGLIGALCTVGFPLLGLGGLFIVSKKLFGIGFDVPGQGLHAAVAALGGFVLGAALVPLFSRAAGGIFAHAAEQGASLLEHAEPKAKSDDVRNPATVVRLAAAGVASPGTELLAPFAGAVVAAMTLGMRWILPIHHSNPDYETNLVLLPLLLAALGIVCALLGTLLVRAREAAKATASLYLGALLAELLFVAGAWFATTKILLAPVASSFGLMTGTRLFAAVAVGVVAGHIASVLGGMARGRSQGFVMLAAVVLAVGAAAWFAYDVARLYGVTLAAVGLVATAGIHAAVAAYGSIAGGVRTAATLAGLPEEARKRAEGFDAASRKAAGRGRGFAAAAAGLACLAMAGAVRERLGTPLDRGAAPLWAGLAAGILLTALFVLLVRLTAKKAAEATSVEAQRQFKAIDGLLEGKEGVQADCAKAVGAPAGVAVLGLLVPGVLAVLAPLAAGLADPLALTGLLLGTATAGTAAALLPEGAGGDDPRHDAVGPALCTLTVLTGAAALALAPWLPSLSA